MGGKTPLRTRRFRIEEDKVTHFEEDEYRGMGWNNRVQNTDQYWA
jgi:hypothetical protein